MREQYIIKEIKEEIKRRIKEEEKLESFNLFEMDHTPEFKSYHHREYLISYYKKQELNSLLEYINEVSK